MPDSNSEAERDRLNVTMHWYCVPDIDRSIDVLVGRRHLQAGEQLRPVGTQTFEGGLDLGRIAIAVEHRADAPLVDQLRAGRVELRVAGVLGVAEDEDDLAGLSGLERELDPV